MAKRNTNYNRATLLNPHSRLKMASVYLPDLDETFLVRELTAKEVMMNEKLVREINPEDAIVPLCYLLTFGICDAEGNPIYKPEDAVALGENSKNTIILLARKITELTYGTEATNTSKNQEAPLSE